MLLEAVLAELRAPPRDEQIPSHQRRVSIIASPNSPSDVCSVFSTDSCTSSATLPTSPGQHEQERPSQERPSRKRARDETAPADFDIRSSKRVAADKVRALGLGLDRVLALGDAFAVSAVDSSSDPFAAFQCDAKSRISGSDWLERLAVYMTRWLAHGVVADEGERHSCEDLAPGLRCVLMAFVYVDRARCRFPSARLCRRNAHHLLLAGVLAAAKFSEDRRVSHGYWSEVGAVTVTQMNALELELCRMLDFRLRVSAEELRAAFDKALALHL